MKSELPLPPFLASYILPVVALVFATGIFIIDTFTPLGIAVAVLYAVVVLMAGRFLSRGGVMFVAGACIALTALSYAWQHGEHFESGAFVRCLVSMLAIAITTFLALKNQAAGMVLREQARLLDVTHDAVWVRSLSDAITYWNRGAEELYGWTKEEALGSNSHQLLRTVFPAPLDEIFAALFRTGRWEGELVHTKRDGSQIDVASRWSLQQDERGKPLAIMETNNDITERRRAEAKTRQQEKELQLFIDAIPAMAWVTRPDGSAEYLNKRWLDYTGLSLEQASGWNWTAAIHPDDLAGLLDTWRSHLVSGDPVETEARLRRCDGPYRWFLLRGDPLRDDQGNIIKWYGTSTDIEERKQAEDALRRSEAYLAEAQRLSHTGSFGWNVSSGDLYWSAETHRIMQLDPATKPTLDLVLQRTHHDDRAHVQQLLDRVQRNAGDWQLEHRLLMPDGSVKHLRVVARAEVEPSGELEYFGAVMDVTAVKQAEHELQEAHAELAHVNRVTTLGELAASIAHEVNQPIAAVVTNAGAGLRWLGAAPPNLEEARQVLTRIVRDGNRAGEVLGRIRALVKKAPLRRDELDINETIRDVIGLTSSEVQRNSVLLRMELARDLPRIRADRVQLQQVLLNLIVNAIEAMSTAETGPRELTIVSANDGPRGALVAVRDSGPGLDPQCSERLFNPFYTTKSEGLGMGLAISRSIIEAHGGRLSAGPNERRGAVFQFSLPAGGRGQEEAAEIEARPGG